jgi:hypothetical protein
MDRIIEIRVRGNHLTKDNDLAGVQGEANATLLRIDFDEGWDGYTKKVVFLDAKGITAVARTLTADLLEDITKSVRVYLCPIPCEALSEAGRCSFGISGYVDGKRHRTVEDTLKVLRSDLPDEGATPADPMPTQAEQLQVQIDSMLGQMQAMASAAVSAVSAAAISEEHAREDEVSAEASMNVAAESAITAVAARDQAVAAAARAQAEAERATVPAVEGVYNVVLVDRVTGDKWALIVENGAIVLLGVDYSTSTAEPVMIDATTGAAYEMIVESGVLKLMEV